jgi:hypothetical protein
MEGRPSLICILGHCLRLEYVINNFTCNVKMKSELVQELYILESTCLCAFAERERFSIWNAL